MEKDNNVLSALPFIDVSALTYQEWVNVGMALKAEGYDCSVWDDWSKNDSRYRPGECERKWRTFRGSSSPVTGGTIVQMAKQNGWTPFGGQNGYLEWDDCIEYDGDDFTQYTAPDSWNPVADITEYLRILFEPDDIVGYVTGDVWQNQDGKWCPSKGAYDRTAGELLESLQHYPNDLGATFGDWKREAGAWIRFNPLDGEGVKNDNVTKFRYALVESDSMSIADQDAVLRKLELPIACLVHSGGKSLHAIVRIDASDYAEYRKRVEFLYDFLEKNGLVVDKQNRNPSRLSRLPGATRNGNRQYLVDTNIGRNSWTEWMDYVEGATDEMPGMVSLQEFVGNLPVLPEELICGILRRGHKMLVSGPSKAGKSFLLMELAVCIAEGKKWLGFQCKKGRVLYVNLEIDPSSAINRFFKIYEAHHIPVRHPNDIVVWNLRGHAVPMDQLVPKLIRRVRDQHFDAIIIDPIYKVITGDENNASEMGAFCNQFDKICTETGCSTIYCHHHSKGAQGAKKAMDRASGSGVFARDPDAQLDVIQLELSDDLKNNVQDGNATAWRMESSLREFPNIKPVNFWFEYPIHRLDSMGDLDAASAEGSFESVRAKNRKCTSADERRESIDSAYNACSFEEPVTVKAMAEYIGVTERCVRDRLREFQNDYWCKGGMVGRNAKTEN